MTTKPKFNDWKVGAGKPGTILAYDEEKGLLTFKYNEKDAEPDLKPEDVHESVVLRDSETITIDLNEHSREYVNVRGETVRWGNLIPTHPVGTKFRSTETIAHQAYGPSDVYPDNKLIIMPFTEILNHDLADPAFESINSFIIHRKAYVSHTNLICSTINFLRHFYDPKDELTFNFLKLKYMIDDSSDPMTPERFIKAAKTILFTKEVRGMIRQFVEDNYVSYISQPSPTAKFSEKLVFTDEHVKILLCVSTSLKLLAAPLFHYMNTANLQMQDLYEYYEDFLHMFSGKDIDIYSKLRETVKSMVEQSSNIDEKIWGHRELYGRNSLTQTDVFLKKYIIGDNLFRYEFDRSLIAFNQAIISRQLEFFITKFYKKMPVEVSSERDQDGLSGLDKMELNTYKVDESTVILSQVNIKETIRRICKEINVKIDKDELEFYMKYHRVDKFQQQLLNYFYAKYFGGYQDLNLITRRQYMKLLILLKRRLQIQQFVFLPQIISANTDKYNQRKIANQRFLTKIRDTSTYQQLMEDKFSTLAELNKGDFVLGLLSTIINSSFSYVDYDMPEFFGQPIIIDGKNQDAVCDEFLNFLNQV